MKDTNHQISRQIINFAQANGVHLIRMEDLTGIRKTARSRKEAGRNLHSWSHYQLQQFIQYKAEMVGIKVEYVVPKYTSQTCKCGHVVKKSASALVSPDNVVRLKEYRLRPQRPIATPA